MIAYSRLMVQSCPPVFSWTNRTVGTLCSISSRHSPNTHLHAKFSPLPSPSPQLVSLIRTGPLNCDANLACKSFLGHALLMGEDAVRLSTLLDFVLKKKSGKVYHNFPNAFLFILGTVVTPWGARSSTPERILEWLKNFCGVSYYGVY